MRNRTRSMVTLAAVGAVTLGLVPAANAQPFQETIRDEFQNEIEDFCGEEGLTVQEHVVFESRLMINPRKTDRLAYFMENQRISVVLTSENGTVTVRETVLSKDLDVTDNGDGTLTILVMGTGNATAFDEDGKAIARNPGQIRFEILIDHGGTPQDPSDDEFLADLGVVFGSTGRNDDFCQAAVPVLTG
jgi:hypothetical protein